MQFFCQRFQFVIFLQLYGDTSTRLQRAGEIFFGVGMSMNGVRSCGDYMFSGHTVSITLLNFFITECKFTHNSHHNDECIHPRELIICIFLT